MDKLNNVEKSPVLQNLQAFLAQKRQHSVPVFTRGNASDIELQGVGSSSQITNLPLNLHLQPDTCLSVISPGKSHLASQSTSAENQNSSGAEYCCSEQSSGVILGEGRLSVLSTTSANDPGSIKSSMTMSGHQDVMYTSCQLEHRTRSANYSKEDKDLLIATVLPFMDILDDKRADYQANKKKENAWNDIVRLFNLERTDNRRDKKQLRELWKRLKDRARKTGSCFIPATTSTTIVTNNEQDTPSTPRASSKLTKTNSVHQLSGSAGTSSLVDVNSMNCFFPAAPPPMQSHIALGSGGSYTRPRPSFPGTSTIKYTATSYEQFFLQPLPPCTSPPMHREPQQQFLAMQPPPLISQPAPTPAKPISNHDGRQELFPLSASTSKTLGSISQQISSPATPIPNNAPRSVIIAPIIKRKRRDSESTSSTPNLPTIENGRNGVREYSTSPSMANTKYHVSDIVNNSVNDRQSAEESTAHHVSMTNAKYHYGKETASRMSDENETSANCCATSLELLSKAAVEQMERKLRKADCRNVERGEGEGERMEEGAAVGIVGNLHNLQIVETVEDAFEARASSPAIVRSQANSPASSEEENGPCDVSVNALSHFYCQHQHHHHHEPDRTEQQQLSASHTLPTLPYAFESGNDLTVFPVGSQQGEELDSAGLTLTLHYHQTMPEADGRPSNRELTPEADDMNYAIPTPPPLKAENVMNSPPPQQNHPGQMHSGASSGGLGGGRGGGASGGSAGASATPPPPKESSPQQLLCVRWGNYDSNIVTMFSKLRNLEHFVDVTLWCEGRTIKCHKMILSACSTYFETLLTEMPNLHPIIFLKDMRFWEIQALVEFMYKGEVSIHQEKLQSLLRAAESLQIKGLGSPSNEIGGGGGGGGGGGSSNNEQGSNSNSGGNNGSEQQGQQQSNSSVDMPTSSQNHLHNHLLPHHNVSAGHAALSSLHHSLTHATNHINSIRSDSQHINLSQHSLMSTPNMGIDLSNHGSGGLNLHSTPLSSSSPQSGVPSKRRKKETPRRIDIPRANLPIANFSSPIPQQEEIMEDDDVASDDSMAAHERNHIDGMKSEQATDMTYDDSNDGEGQENYSENYTENDQGNQSHDENSSDQGGEMDDDMDGNGGGGGNGGALSLLINSNANNLERERERERERSRKGNPIKKIHLGIGNNNNNNDSLLHSASSAAD